MSINAEKPQITPITQTQPQWYIHFLERVNVFEKCKTKFISMRRLSHFLILHAPVCWPVNAEYALTGHVCACVAVCVCVWCVLSRIYVFVLALHGWNMLDACTHLQECKASHPWSDAPAVLDALHLRCATYLLFYMLYIYGVSPTCCSTCSISTVYYL